MSMSATALQDRPVASTSRTLLQPLPAARLGASSSRSYRNFSAFEEQPRASTSRTVLPSSQTTQSPPVASSSRVALQPPPPAQNLSVASPSRSNRARASVSATLDQRVASTSQSARTSSSAAQQRAEASTSRTVLPSPPATPSAQPPSSAGSPPGSPISDTRPGSPTPSSYSTHLRTLASLSDLIARWRGKDYPSVTKISGDTPETHLALREIRGKASSTINETDTFECEHAVNLTLLLNIARENLLERAKIKHGDAVLVGEQWKCTIRGPIPQKAAQRPSRMYRVKVYYSARPVKLGFGSTAKDPGIPINLDRTGDTPGIMRIKEHRRGFLLEDYQV